jgi:hypothetical protein
MGCKTKNNTKKFLIEKGYIDKDSNILNSVEFEKVAELLNKQVNTKYNLKDAAERKLLSTGVKTLKGGITKKHVVFNDRMFSVLDTIVEDVDKELAGKIKKRLVTLLDFDLADVINDSNTDIFRGNELTMDELLIDNSTLESRIHNTVKKLTVSLEMSINSLTREVEKSNSKEETHRAATFEKQIESLESIQEKLNSVELIQKILAVETFTNYMSKNMEVIKKALNRIDTLDSEHLFNAVKIYDKVVNSYTIIEDVQDLIATIETENYTEYISEEQLLSMKTSAEQASGKFYSTRKQVKKLTEKYMIDKLSHVKYFKEVQTKHYNRLAKEFDTSKLPGDKAQWIIKTMANRDKDRIQADVAEAVVKLINNPAWDIYAADVHMSSGLNVSSTLVQIVHQLLTEVDEKRNKERVAKDLEFDRLFRKLKEEKGTNNPLLLYENIVDQDSNNKIHLKGEFKASFLTDVHHKIMNIKKKTNVETDALWEQMAELEEDGIAYNKLRIKRQEIIKKSQDKIDVIIKDNTKKLPNGEVTIKKKWKNDFSNLSKTEKEVLDFLIETTDEIHKMTYAGEATANIKYASRSIPDLKDNLRFYELPKITQSDTERFWRGDLKGMVEDKVKELKGLRPDDFGYAERLTDISGRKLRALKVWYRDPAGSFNNDDQSMDLFGIMRMDYISGMSHQIRGEAEQDINFLLDIAKNKEYYNKSGTIPIVSKLFKKYDIISGESSNTVKMLNNMVEAKFYETLHKGNAAIGKADANKVIKFINSTSAFLTLSLNAASGTANVLNANAQLFIESFWKGRFITAGSLKQANLIYSTTLGDSMQDLVRPYARSFPNQLQEYFNTKGLFELAGSDFLRTDMTKVGLHLDSLRVFQESGEHYIQSVTVMGVLGTIKVMDENHNFINKEGNIVESEKEAASVLDMMKVNEIDGLIGMDPKVVYTTHSALTKWDEGGKEALDSLTAKKLYDVMGNYRPSDQPDITRVWYGKLVMLYRKFLVPMGQARLRGFESSFTRKENLKDYERTYSYALQEYEEGYYSTFIRYIMTSVKDKKMYLLAKEPVWDNLTDYEKHNIKKTFIEMAMTSAMIPLSIMLVQALQGEDDDNEWVFFLLYQLRRLDTELSQYKNVSESFKMMRSPIPSARLVETVLSIMSDTFQFWKWGDTYQNGHNKDKNKLATKILKQIPVAKEFNRTYKDLFEYQNSYFGFK